MILKLKFNIHLRQQLKRYNIKMPKPNNKQIFLYKILRKLSKNQKQIDYKVFNLGQAEKAFKL